MKNICLFLTLLTVQANADTLIVLNKSSNTASLVDLETRKVITELPTGEGPHEVVVSDDGKIAVVSNYGKAEAGFSLSVLDIGQSKVLRTVNLGSFHRPHGLAWIKGSREVLVTVEDDKSLLRVDVEDGKVLSSIKTSQEGSHMVVSTPDGKQAFVANIGSGSVTAIDLNKSEKITDILSGKGSEGIDISPDGKTIWVTNRGADSVSVINVESRKVTNQFKVEGFPIRAKYASSNTILVTSAKSGFLNIFDAKKLKLIHAIDFGPSQGDVAGKMFGKDFSNSTVPIGIAVDPKRNFAYVAHANSDFISIIDLKNYNLVGKLVAGREPDGMAYTSISVKKKK